MTSISRPAPLRSSALAAVLCSVGAVLAACGASPSSTGSSSTAHPSTASSPSAPPGLAALVSRSAATKIDSLSFTLRATVPGVAGGAPSTLDGAATLRLHPSLAGNLNFTAAGRSTIERFAGGSIYIELPAIAARDGGRPWVVVSPNDVSSAVGFNYTALLRQAQRLDPTKSLQLLAAEKNFRETGPTTINGQRVVGMTGAFTPATLKSPGLSPALLAQLKAKLAQVGATREVVNAYLTYAGVPVRIETTLVTKTYGTLTSTVDITSVNIPVTATPPPASETITLAEAQKLG